LVEYELGTASHLYKDATFRMKKQVRMVANRRVPLDGAGLQNYDADDEEVLNLARYTQRHAQQPEVGALVHPATSAGGPRHAAAPVSIVLPDRFVRKNEVKAH